MSKKEQQEQQIISHLRTDARTSLSSISQMIEMPISTVHDKINRLQKSKVIEKYTTLVNFSKLGYHYQAKIALKVPRQQKNELLLFLRNHPAVNSICEVSNSFDYFIESVHEDTKSYLLFIGELQECFEIQLLQEYQVLEEIEKEKFLR